MGRFEVIASSGHCGTMWLSQVLDAGTGARWYHERRRALAGPWYDALRLGPGHAQYDTYWQMIRAEQERGDVGDANSWIPTLLPDAARIVPISRVIYLTRNPIQQLHSLASRSYVWSRNPSALPGAADDYLSSLQVLAEYYRFPKTELSHWERLCLLVKANEFMPQYLRNRGLYVEVVELEALTTDAAALQRLAPRLSADAARLWQVRDLNRKVYGDRTPAALWGQWTPVQRDGFERVVGNVEKHIGETDAERDRVQERAGAG